MNNPNFNNVFYYSIVKTALGWIGIAGNQEGLRRCVLPENTRESVLLELNRYLHPRQKLIQTDDQFFSVVIRIKEYFDGKVVQFDKDVINLEGYTYFQKNILQKTREIPYGVTKTYKLLAKHAGYPKAYRAVGGVMRINPLPLIIPCHRVIGSYGKLTGFSATGGLELKRKMLESEGVFLKKSRIN
ncbi:MAG: methylated-DNA--[protein]-cysteine S-methyltransferase [Atribacterota bacterium]|nr:methylated-DNA--[protein]-cysteine S-methyltransferase [Atribacterota bacterium]